MPFIPFIVVCAIGFTGLLSSAIKAVCKERKTKNARIEKIVAEAEARKLRELESARRKAIVEEERRQRERRQKERQQQISAEAKKLREKEMSEQWRMAAEQRRLMKASLRYEILTRDGFRCRICGASADDGVTLHVDHIIPVSKGGKTEKSNLRTLCDRCNLGKGDKIESIPVPSVTAQCAIPSQPVVLPQPVIPEPEEAFTDTQNLSMNEVIQLLNTFSIRYVDNTDRGGCFWIELTTESELLLHDKTIDGKRICTANHSKAFSNAPALYVK